MEYERNVKENEDRKMADEEDLETNNFETNSTPEQIGAKKEKNRKGEIE